MGLASKNISLKESKGTYIGRAVMGGKTQARLARRKGNRSHMQSRAYVWWQSQPVRVIAGRVPGHRTVKDIVQSEDLPTL